MNYLVIGSGGPALTVPEDMIELMEDYILPGFEALAKLQQENKILAGGVPVSERAIAFIIDAASNEEARPDNARPAFMAGPGVAGNATTELRGEGVPRPPDAATTKTGIDRESGKSGAHIPGAQRPLHEQSSTLPSLRRAGAPASPLANAKEGSHSTKSVSLILAALEKDRVYVALPAACRRTSVFWPSSILSNRIVGNPTVGCTTFGIREEDVQKLKRTFCGRRFQNVP